MVRLGNLNMRWNLSWPLAGYVEHLLAGRVWINTLYGTENWEADCWYCCQIAEWVKRLGDISKGLPGRHETSVQPTTAPPLFEICHNCGSVAWSPAFPVSARLKAQISISQKCSMREVFQLISPRAHLLCFHTHLFAGKDILVLCPLGQHWALSPTWGWSSES